ncbi:biosynthetic-type acetolactate synthase large subunit [Sedimentisphaera salicampi]|uniref:biosynthetic-type acetolactate synthase large subunit n=1 Tax=Sedimentisphaera salicampi TaxID=1941349 RepID=UPI000B9A2632|nr:biosynthetic-type acetolactate synthase large subunit [Sedimentisphaera salicampi]OXU15208.1 Acetolactate synthase large subunit [Sedimentisphaera salicampi]
MKNSSNAPEMQGAQIIVEILKEQGVDTMFGYLGGVVLPIFDKLYDSDIRFITPRHEQGGAHMADAYARCTGKTGVCIATSGPGATNLTTGIANAMMDSVPMVALTGQVRTELIGGDAFQEVDTTGITRPITKHNVIVKDVNNLAEELRQAFYIASTGRPGPVLVDIPVDVSVGTGKLNPPSDIDMPGYKPRVEGHKKQIEAAADAINKSKRPVLYIGGGVIISNASREITDLAEKANIPVTTTLMGMGAFDQNSPLSLDMLGMHGAAYANMAVQNSDLLIAVGSRFDDRVTGQLKRFCPNAKILHVDIDPASISKNVQVHVPVVGDAKLVLPEITELLEYSDRGEWFAQISEWKKAHPFTYDKNATSIKPQYVIEELWNQTKGEATITTGVGQHQMWAAQFYKYKYPRQFITSGGLGTMGFGLPSAIGAQVARPDSTVIDIDGDSSFNMTMTELSTAVMYKLPVKAVVLNNGYMGMVRQWQELFYQRRYSHSHLLNPNFADVAKALGAGGISIEKKDEVQGAIEKMLSYDGPFVLDCRIEPEENVWPMVSPGKALDEMAGLEIFEKMP